MKTLKKVYVINSPVEKVWEALVNSVIIEKWGAGPAKMRDEESFEFSLWGGEIFGKNTKIIKNKLLVQDWFGGKWDDPSVATFKLSPLGEGKTQIEFFQENIPDKELEEIDRGWDEYYLGPLKKYLENK